jgi:isopenicillin-N N-acyltransferase like protein
MKKTISLLLCIIFAAGSVSACTIWGAAGDVVKLGGSLIAKNFDYNPKYYTRLEFVRPRHGHAYAADVMFGPGIIPSVQGGINERGLVIVSAATPLKKSSGRGGHIGFNERVLRNYSSVDGFLADKNMLKLFRSGFFLIGDRKKIALIEIAPGEGHNIWVVENGPLYHANDYLCERFLSFNEIPSSSSLKRYARIKELMTHHDGPFGMDDFIKISEDQHDGPGASLWRVGKTPTGERTLATWIVRLHANGSPVIYLKTANTGEKIKSVKMVLDHKFWKRHPAGEIYF